jgi:hypothetical protein
MVPSCAHQEKALLGPTRVNLQHAGASAQELGTLIITEQGVLQDQPVDQLWLRQGPGWPDAGGRAPVAHLVFQTLTRDVAAGQFGRDFAAGNLSQDGLTDPLLERRPGSEVRSASSAGQVSRIMDLVWDPNGGAAARSAGKGRGGTRAVTHHWSSLVWLRNARIFGGGEPVRQMPWAFRAILSAQPSAWTEGKAPEDPDARIVTACGKRIARDNAVRFGFEGSFPQGTLTRPELGFCEPNIGYPWLAGDAQALGALTPWTTAWHYPADDPAIAAPLPEVAEIEQWAEKVEAFLNAIMLEIAP